MPPFLALRAKELRGTKSLESANEDRLKAYPTLLSVASSDIPRQVLPRSPLHRARTSLLCSVDQGRNRVSWRVLEPRP